MVNYCCVYGCGRNSRLNKHLIFYSVPKEKHRQMLWLKAAGREDLLTNDEKAILRKRFCSRHFHPSCIKKRSLNVDAVPTLHLSNSESEADADWGAECVSHEGIVCNNCQEAVSGYRYKCVSCTDYDLCQKCEGLEVHPDHFMLRIPKPMKLIVAENLTKQLHTLLKAEHLTLDDPSDHDEGADMGSESSDDEPITKYASNYDSGVDLSEDVKERIRKEVSRVLKMKSKKSKPKQKTGADKKRSSDESLRFTKKPKLEDSRNYTTSSNTLIETMAEVEITPEVAFADVNAVKDNQTSETKAEHSESVNDSSVPVMHLKLSDDLSELMIEVTSNNEKTVYKYGDSRWNRGHSEGS